MNKWDMKKTETFPWFEPTIHSWFENKWDEKENPQTKWLGKRLEDFYSNIHRKTLKGIYGTYDLFVNGKLVNSFQSNQSI